MFIIWLIYTNKGYNYNIYTQYTHTYRIIRVNWQVWWQSRQMGANNHLTTLDTSSTVDERSGRALLQWTGRTLKKQKNLKEKSVTGGEHIQMSFARWIFAEQSYKRRNWGLNNMDTCKKIPCCSRRYLRRRKYSISTKSNMFYVFKSKCTNLYHKLRLSNSLWVMHY
jgi:hypothetical protein